MQCSMQDKLVLQQGSRQDERLADALCLLPFPSAHQLSEDAALSYQGIETPFLRHTSITQTDDTIAPFHSLDRMGDEDGRAGLCEGLVSQHVPNRKLGTTYILDLHDRVQDSPLIVHIQCTRTLVQNQDPRLSH